MAKVGRNEACPCGSGRKYKKCCEGAEQKRSNVMVYTVGGIVLSALLLGILQFAAP
jgi:hypothetical protein